MSDDVSRDDSARIVDATKLSSVEFSVSSIDQPQQLELEMSVPEPNVPVEIVPVEVVVAEAKPAEVVPAEVAEVKVVEAEAPKVEAVEAPVVEAEVAETVVEAPVIEEVAAAEEVVAVDEPTEQADVTETLVVAEKAVVAEATPAEATPTEQPSKVAVTAVVEEPSKPATETKAESAKPMAAAAEAASEPVSELTDADFETTNPFEEMGLSPAVLEAIANAGYTEPSDIQAETIPIVLASLDIIGQAETGSGKTAAFALPLLSKIDMTARKPQVLVLAPTRELALQVTASFNKYAANIKGFRAVTIYGGQNYETQIRALNRGVQVVVGTPGRVMDHIRRETLDLSALATFVLDEADEMLRMGFVDDIEWILEHIPRERHTVMFSATMPDDIRRIARQHLRNPKHITIQSKTATADSITQLMSFVHPRDKTETLDRILQTEERDAVLVFTKTKTTTVVVAEFLSARGYKVSALNGDIPQNQRERTVNQLKSGRLDIVIATDVAARGLDVERISHVINYDFPHDTEAYVHRIGRTGRAGREGTAILFVEPREKGKLSRLQRATNQRISQLREKSLDEINDIRVEKFLHKVAAAGQNDQATMFKKILARHQKETETPIEDIAAALAVLAQGGTPLILKEIQRSRSNDRGGKDGRDSRGGRDRGPRRENNDLTTFRIEVGKSHGVGVGNIVGAITNEANLNSGDIGRIKLFDDFSLVDLPKDLPDQTVDHLAGVYVSNRPLQIKPDAGGSGGGRRFESRPSYSKKNNGSTRFGKRFEKKEGGFKGKSGYQGNNPDGRSSGGYKGKSDGGSYKGKSEGGYKGKSDSGYRSKPEGGYRSKPEGGGYAGSKNKPAKPWGSSSEGSSYQGKSKSGKFKKPSKRKGGPSADGPAKKYVKIRSANK